MVEKYKISLEITIDDNKITQIVRDNILDYYTYQDIIKILVEEIMDGGSNIISNKKKRKKKSFTEFKEELG
jgi:uncharacterized protein YutE (UPF0331/DUF86 family)